MGRGAKGIAATDSMPLTSHCYFHILMVSNADIHKNNTSGHNTEFYNALWHQRA